MREIQQEKIDNKNEEGKNMKNYQGYYIIRTEKAGVFAANIKERNGQEATLINCRRLWYWDGANSLSQLAVDGVSKPKNCKFTIVVDEMEVLGVIEIIPCTKKAEDCIKAVAIWKQ